jgi:hypothetical protein
MVGAEGGREGMERWVGLEQEVETGVLLGGKMGDCGHYEGFRLHSEGDRKPLRNLKQKSDMRRPHFNRRLTEG